MSLKKDQRRRELSTFGLSKGVLQANKMRKFALKRSNCVWQNAGMRKTMQMGVFKEWPGAGRNAKGKSWAESIYIAKALIPTGWIKGPGCDQGTRKMSMTTVMILAPLISHCNWGPRIIYSFAHSLNSICWLNNCGRHSSRHWGYSSGKIKTCPHGASTTIWDMMQHLSPWDKSLCL